MAKVLYIDDREALRRAMLGALRARGHETFEAGTGQEGLASLEKHHPDLVLCRADLPQMGGISLIEQAHSNGEAQAQFILLSDTGDAAARLHDIELGADDSLPVGDAFDAARTLIMGRLRLVDRLTKQRERELVRLYSALVRQQQTRPGLPSSDAAMRRLAEFAFISADILLELDCDHQVHFAAVGGVPVACEPFNTHPGGPFGLFVETAAAGHLGAELRALQPGARIGSLLCPIAGSQGAFIARASRDAGPEDRIRVTFIRQKTARAEIPADAAAQGETPVLPGKEAFTRIAAERLKKARRDNAEAELTLVDVPGLASLGAYNHNRAATQLFTEISLLLRSRSDGGDAAGLLHVDRFGLVHGSDVNAGNLQQAIAEMIAAQGLDQQGLTASARSVALTGDALSEEQAFQAVAYAVNRFAAKGGADFSITNLTDSMSAYVDETITRISSLRTHINGNQFELHFQPIVNLQSREPHHYEALVRFPQGGSPFETILFAERTGMVQELDLAICRLVIDHIRQHKRSGRNVEIAVNISACSIESSLFVTLLQRLMAGIGNDRQQILLEITESAQIRNYEEVANVMRNLRSAGHKICLDDFGAGESNFNYLRMFEVDYVKIDGVYIRDVLRSPRDQAFIRNIINLCRDIHVGTVAEFVEREEQAAALLGLGVDLGQGYLFGKPSQGLGKRIRTFPPAQTKH